MGNLKGPIFLLLMDIKLILKIKINFMLHKNLLMYIFLNKMVITVKSKTKSVNKKIISYEHKQTRIR